MPLEGIFLEPSSSSSSSKPLPDLSLHISPPNCDSSFDISKNSNTYKDTSFTDLSLAHPSNDDVRRTSCNVSTRHLEHTQNPYRHIYNYQGTADSLLEAAASDGLKPIKGIPVYPNRPFPFLAHVDNRRSDKDQKMRFYHHHQMSYPSPAPYFVNGLDHHMPMLNLGPNSGNSAAAAAVAYRGGAAPRFTSGFHHHNYEASHHHGIMRSRFLAKIPTKRSMRAPRMRWTSTLHSRFVHAVELLGGHESNFTIFLFFYNY